MSTLATDDFNRANAGTLGASYTRPTGVSAGNEMGVVGNQVVPTDGTATAVYTGDHGAYWNDISAPADQWASMAVTTGGTAGGEIGIGLLLRQALAADTYYRIVVSADGVSVAKTVGSTYSLVWTRAITWVNGDVLRAEMQGTTLRVYRNGVQLGSDTSDPSIASGQPGVFYSSTASGAVGDDWNAGNFFVTGQISSGVGIWGKRDRKLRAAILGD